MPANSKTILIETERTETLVVRIAGNVSPVKEYCECCGTETQMLDLNSAVTLSGRGARDLIHEIETGLLHSAQTLRGHLLICTISLQTPCVTEPEIK